jgi:hypothetical protein
MARARKSKIKSPAPLADIRDLTMAQAQAILDQVWPLLDVGSATQAAREYALLLAEHAGDTYKQGKLVNAPELREI